MEASGDLNLADILSEHQGLDHALFSIIKISLDFSHLVYLYSELYSEC